MAQNVGIALDEARTREGRPSADPRSPWTAPHPDGPDRARAVAGLIASREFISFAAIGVFCTILFAIAYQLVRGWLPPLAANSVALLSTAGVNFAANRQFTFPDRKGPAITQASRYFVFYIFGLAVSSIVLFLFLLVWREPSRPVELIAALLASGLATAIRYAAMSLWVFAVPRP